MKELHAIIHGKVQRVWFRKWTQKQAQELRVHGWVRNMENGNVELLAQADSTNLMAFMERLYDGPELAHVTHIDSSMKPVTEKMTSFEIRP